MRLWLLVAALCLTSFACGSGGPAARQVVVYTSLDQRYSEPILRAYQRKTGVDVKPVYDTEATKTVGLANRLLAEQEAPRADVFWNSEILRTIQLERAGVLAPYRSPSAEGFPSEFVDPGGYWTGFGARVRVLAVNTERLSPDERPRNLDQLLDPVWRGRFAMAWPLFGTTSTHVAALFALWGPERAETWLRALAANEPLVVDGNSTARDRVVAGAVPVALTDSDDVAVAERQGHPIDMVFPDPEGAGTLVIPNTVALIAGAPHPEEGRALIDYLLSEDVERALARADGAQIPLRPGLPWPQQLPPRETLRILEVDFDAVADHLPAATKLARELFVR